MIVIVTWRSVVMMRMAVIVIMPAAMAMLVTVARGGVGAALGIERGLDRGDSGAQRCEHCFEQKI